MYDRTIKEIEENIKEANKKLDVGVSMERLLNNRDFKKVVMEGYFEKEAIRLVHLKSDVNMQTEASQQSINKQMDAIGNLSQYFSEVLRQAELAEKAIESDESTRDELLAEGL